MRRFRYSIASLLGLVLFVAIAVAALRQADDLWDSGVFTLSACLLLISVLLAIHRTGRRRAFWLGFALCGAAYLIASLIPPVEPRLLTSKGLAYLDSKVPGRDTPVRLGLTWLSRSRPTAVVKPVAFSPDGRLIATQQAGTVRLWDATTGLMMGGPNGTSEDFIRIGHSLTALILALAGGFLSRSLYAGRVRTRGATEPTGRSGPGPAGG